MKPIVFYIDDEPHNLTVFEAAMPADWEVITFDGALNALSALEKQTPAVVITDQRMPGMNGVQLLELVKKICPQAIRIIATGYSDEDLIVESVRKAQIFDYIRKPWDVDDLVQTISNAIDLYKANENARILQDELRAREAQLKAQTESLLKLTSELEKSTKREADMRTELECWVPPFVLWALRDQQIKFPIRKDVVGITFDIIDSSTIHETYVANRPIRSLIIQLFSEAIMRNGGWRESHSGDSAFGHFGLLDASENPFEAAFGAAREFRVSLRNLCDQNNIAAECGIALHVAKNSVVDIHNVQLNTPKGYVTQKSFDTTSIDIDLLHKMEKLVHSLPGSNIIMSKDFLIQLRKPPVNLVDLGQHLFKGKSSPLELCIVPSDKLQQSDLTSLRSHLVQDKKAAA